MVAFGGARLFNKGMYRAPGIGIIGIAAPTCAGKTSLLAELGERLPKSSAVLSFDEYDLFPAGSEAMEKELAERSITNWEDPALFDMATFASDVLRIAKGQKVELETRSRESIDRGETNREFVPPRVNFIEGVFVLLDPSARAVMDETFYIDISPEEMVRRRLETLRPGVSDNPWDDPEYIQGAMVEGTREFVLPQRELASVVHNGMLPASELADQVIRYTGRL